MRKTKKLLVLDNTWLKFGLSSEISRLILEKYPNILNERLISLGNNFSPCPTAKSLEDKFYPDVNLIIKSIINITKKDKKNLNNYLLEDISTTDYLKKFKGPF